MDGTSIVAKMDMLTLESVDSERCDVNAVVKTNGRTSLRSSDGYVDVMKLSRTVQM